MIGHKDTPSPVEELASAPLDWANLVPGRRHDLSLPVCPHPNGGVVSLPLIVLAGHRAQPRLLVTAGVHGDEYEGMMALYRLAETLDPTDLAATIVLAPVVNPPAFAAGTRLSPVDGVNLARIFPGNPDGTISERIAHTVVERLLPGSDLLIDLHSGGVRYAFAQLAGFYAFADAAGQASRRLATVMGFPYLWQLPPQHGVLSYAAALRGIPAIGTEVTGMGGCRDEDVALYHQALRRVIDYLTDPQAADPAPVPVWDGDWLLSPGAGLFEPRVALHQAVAADAVVAIIRDGFGRVRQTLHAPHAGRVLALRHVRSIGVGEWAVMILNSR